MKKIVIEKTGGDYNCLKLQEFQIVAPKDSERGRAWDADYLCLPGFGAGFETLSKGFSFVHSQSFVDIVKR